MRIAWGVRWVENAGLMRVMLEQWLGGRPSALRMGSTRQLRSWICSVARRIPSSASLGLPDCSKLDMLGLQDTYTVANERILGLKLPEICYLICRNPSIDVPVVVSTVGPMDIHSRGFQKIPLQSAVWIRQIWIEPHTSPKW